MDAPLKRQRERSNQPQEAGRDRCLVICRLRRNTFLPGEQIRGTLIFDVSSKDQSYVAIEQATVQAHGYVKVDPRWISLPTSLRSLFKQEETIGTDDDNRGGRTPRRKLTVFAPLVPVLLPRRYSGLDDNSSACVFASELAVLLEKEQVVQGEPASFSFSLVLPEKLTPTFRGVGVRYAYAVTVRIKRALPPPPSATGLLGLVRRRPTLPASGGFSTTDLHVAFTVLSEGPAVAPFTSAGLGRETGGSEGGWDGVAFAELEIERLSREAFELAAERARTEGLVSGTRAVTWNMQGRMLDDGAGNITTSALLGGGAWDDGGEGGGIPSPPPPPMVYAIRSGDHRIGSFVLHKPEFCAGDIVLGIFDFSSASTRCLQLCACLEVSEENASIGENSSSTPDRRKPSGGGKNPRHKRVVDSFKELTPCVVQSSVALSLPTDAPVSFSTELVTVSWALRFEFIMSPPESRWAIGGYPPSKASVLRWSMPIKVVPPRRMLYGGGGMAGGRELSFNAMDSTGRSVMC
ncbi:unnamed protein product [Ascophyllum nodosum]